MDGRHQIIGKRSDTKKGMTTDEVYQRIKEMIYHNQVAPGQKLIYNDIGRRLNVSSTPVVQAMNRLEASGLVEYRPNKGYFVGEITETEATQLYQAREALEIYIIPAVIRNLDPKKLDDIQATFKRYEETDRRRLILIDAQFHLKIAEYSHNDVIYKLLKDIFERIYLKYRPEYLADTRVRQVIKEHRMLLQALRRGDEKNVVAITKQHLAAGMSHVLSSLRAHSNHIF